MSGKRPYEDPQDDRNPKRPRHSLPPPQTRSYPHPSTSAPRSQQHQYSADSVAPLVASHYNAKPDAGLSVRSQSAIIGLRDFNNWCKAVIIQEFTKRARLTIPHNAQRGLRVLDMCCGKGGDLGKWAKAGIQELVGLDIAKISIDDAKGRYEEGRRRRGPSAFMFNAFFQTQNCFVRPLSDSLGPNPPPFDLVSTQFSWHYSFENEGSARQALKNVSDALRPGGFFIGTLPDAYWIVKRLKSENGLSFGNSIYSIKFEQRDKFPLFGHKYWFVLEDAIDNAPEFLVHFPSLTRLAAEYGLKLVFKKRLHDLYLERSQEGDDGQLFRRMLGNKVITDDEWEAIGIYLAFGFQKQEPAPVQQNIL
ncbi:hypothetical protein SmJEL517_g06023 [Synchytrium microbalum]|uniref:mRNA cap guanine-N(7) methyltransferase n=1 Tax=Synchytrium microbalum TaxID=1806994 RepID=A0A507BHT7_9FUNG|nr:uncharacterized protein SmJEL517_g06023 [Synchytrium microbalum]TPX30400.1 hypothetical protein SmJEL517_g06023 [Synchytrium microbalum]